MFEGDPGFGERVDRAEIERELRREYSATLAARSASEQDRRVLALVVSAGLVLGLCTPFIALVLGFSWRVLMWSAGGGW